MEGVLLNGMIILILLLLSIEDIRHQSIRLWELIALISIAFIYSSCSVRYEWHQIFISVLVCGATLWISWITKCLGAADILVIFMLNCVKGTVFSLVVFSMAITLAAVINIFLCISKRVCLKSSIPFIPYISVCTLGAMICI